VQSAKAFRVESALPCPDTRPQSENSLVPRRLDLIGRTISHYLILEKLGARVVYNAEDTRLDRFVTQFLPDEVAKQAPASGPLRACGQSNSAKSYKGEGRIL
jgi:hypothetical protein